MAAAWLSFSKFAGAGTRWYIREDRSPSFPDELVLASARELTGEWRREDPRRELADHFYPNVLKHLPEEIAQRSTGPWSGWRPFSTNGPSERMIRMAREHGLPFAVMNDLIGHDEFSIHNHLYTATNVYSIRFAWP